MHKLSVEQGGERGARLRRQSHRSLDFPCKEKALSLASRSRQPQSRAAGGPAASELTTPTASDTWGTPQSVNREVQVTLTPTKFEKRTLLRYRRKNLNSTGWAGRRALGAENTVVPGSSVSQGQSQLPGRSGKWEKPRGEPSTRLDSSVDLLRAQFPEGVKSSARSWE